MDDKKLDIDSLISLVNIPEIADDCNFWMIRSKSGVFYQEFIEDGFIAIGWNVLSRENCNSKGSSLIDLIKKNYSTDKAPSASVNKCLRFISEMKENDIAVVVGVRFVSFVKIGEYFEASGNAFSVEKELEVHKQIDANIYDSEIFPCPYRKRRHIEIIKRNVPTDKLNPYLYKAFISNRHSLSNLNDYAKYILPSSYDIYHHADSISLAFRVTRKSEIDAIEFSGFIYAASKLLSAGTDCKVFSRSNVHSEGDIILQIYTDVKTFLTQNVLWFMFLYIAIFGGKMPGFEVSGVMGILEKFLDRKHKQRMQEIEATSGELDNEGKALENEKLRYEIEKDKSLEALAHQVGKTSKALDIAPVDENNVQIRKMFQLNVSEFEE